MLNSIKTKIKTFGRKAKKTMEEKIEVAKDILADKEARKCIGIVGIGAGIGIIAVSTCLLISAYV